MTIENDVLAFLEALPEAQHLLFDAVAQELKVRSKEGQDLTVSLDWLALRRLVRIEPSENQLGRLKRTMLSMKVGPGFTWNDYAHACWAAIIASD